MSDMIDMETIYRHERARWMRDEAPRKSIRDVIAAIVPYWIVLVALVLYCLSAPHTAGVFEKLTPNWGWIAPVGVEFGLLYAAFRRRLARDSRQSLPWTLWALELLLFLTSILVNGTGAFTSVVMATGLDALSFAVIFDQFGELPAISQAALVMAGLSAFIIPIGTLVAGEGLAAIVLEKRITSDFREERWRDVEFTLFYRAVFVRYLQQGMADRDAKLRALSEVKGYLGKATASPVQALPAGSAQSVQHVQVKSVQANGIKGKIHAFLIENPDAARLSINDVQTALGEQGVRAGRTTVAEVLREVRKTHIK